MALNKSDVQAFRTPNSYWHHYLCPVLLYSMTVSCVFLIRRVFLYALKFLKSITQVCLCRSTSFSVESNILLSLVPFILAPHYTHLFGNHSTSGYTALYDDTGWRGSGFPCNVMAPDDNYDTNNPLLPGSCHRERHDRNLILCPSDTRQSGGSYVTVAVLPLSLLQRVILLPLYFNFRYLCSKQW